MTVADAEWVGKFAAACARAIHAAHAGNLEVTTAELERTLSSFAASDLCDEVMLEYMAPFWRPTMEGVTT